MPTHAYTTITYKSNGGLQENIYIGIYYRKRKCKHFEKNTETR